MILWQLFYTFLLVGAFTFGGGYSMIALIQDQVVDHWHWMSTGEFADLVAVSQFTPGPVGINTATYAGYTAAVNAGYPVWVGIAGSLTASMAVIDIPVAMVLLVGRLLMDHIADRRVETVMRIVRLTVVGLIAAAALSLVNTETFGSIDSPAQLITSILIFAAVFILALKKKASPILLIVASGAVGLLVYGVLPSI